MFNLTHPFYILHYIILDSTLQAEQLDSYNRIAPQSVVFD
jgi:hypothetical protein